MGENPKIYRDVEITTLDFPYALTIAPAGAADMVLTFRNAYNWVIRIATSTLRSVNQTGRP